MIDILRVAKLKVKLKKLFLKYSFYFFKVFLKPLTKAIHFLCVCCKDRFKIRTLPIVL